MIFSEIKIDLFPYFNDDAILGLKSVSLVFRADKMLVEAQADCEHYGKLTKLHCSNQILLPNLDSAVD